MNSEVFWHAYVPTKTVSYHELYHIIPQVQLIPITHTVWYHRTESFCGQVLTLNARILVQPWLQTLQNNTWCTNWCRLRTRPKSSNSKLKYTQYSCMGSCLITAVSFITMPAWWSSIRDEWLVLTQKLLAYCSSPSSMVDIDAALFCTSLAPSASPQQASSGF